jgi:hypothetical protein
MQKLKINVIVNAPDNPIFLLTVSENYTQLGFQPVKGDLLTINPENTTDFQSISNKQAGSQTPCFLEVYKRELNTTLKQLDVFCSIKK